MRPVLAFLILVGITLAAPKAPECVKDSKTALEIARTRGKLIFLTVMVDNDGENRMVIDAVFRNKAFIKISREFVCLLANPQDEHGKVAVQDKKSGKRVHRCADCPSIVCLDHQALAQNFARAFFPGNEARTPIHFVINQDEEVIHTIKNGDFKTGMNHVSGKRVVAELRKVLKKHGRGLSEIEYQGMLKNLTDAKAARARKNVTLELTKLAAVVALRRKVTGVEQARTRITEIDTIAASDMAGLDKATQAKDWETVLNGLGQIVKTYPGTKTAFAAEAKRRDLVKRKDVKKVVKAGGYYRKALAFKQAGKLDLAKKNLERCLRSGAGTPYEALAKKELAALGG